MLRNILAPLVGFIVTIFIVSVGIGLAAMLLLPPPTGGQLPVLTPAYLAANLLISAVAAVAGGWVAGTIGQRASLLHAGVLAGLMLTLSLISLIAEGGAATGQPAWYPYAIALIGPLGALGGGWLQLQWLKSKPPPANPQ